MAGDMTQRLTEIVDQDVPHVREEAIKTLVIVLRTYPSLRLHVIPSLSRCVRVTSSVYMYVYEYVCMCPCMYVYGIRYLRRIENHEAKAGLIWMLGEYATEVHT